MGFDWDDSNRAHIAEHGVTPDEAEEVVVNWPLDLEVTTRKGEERTIQIGETDEGRILVVVSTWRGNKLRVVTAFPANRKLRSIYARHKATE
jgi:uncharacterized DUF497 family protein